MADECDFIKCKVVGETCQGGICRCGTNPSCEKNSQAPTCDPSINRCICGSIGYSHGGCTVANEMCVERECRCGNLSTCNGSPDGPICDAINNQCIMSKLT